MATPSKAPCLDSDETILWSGAPVPGGRLPLSAILTTILGALLFLWGALWAWMVFQTMGFALHMLPMASPFLVLGGLLAAYGPRKTWKRRRNARYLLTERKLVLFPDGLDKSWFVALPEHVLPSEVSVRYDGAGTGTIHLCTIPFEWVSQSLALWTIEHVANPDDLKDRLVDAFRAARAAPPPLPAPIAPGTTMHHVLAPVLEADETLLWIGHGKKRHYAISDRRAFTVVPGPAPTIYAFPPEYWGGFQVAPNRDGTWNLTFSSSSLQRSMRVFPPAREGVGMEQESRFPEAMEGIREPVRALRVLQAVLARRRSGQDGN